MDIFKELKEHFQFPFEPYPYQVKAVAQAIDKPNVLMPLKVGRGKTALATWLGCHHSIHNGVTRLLFIVPAPLVLQWAKWLDTIKFVNGDDLDILAYRGTPKQREKMDFNHDCIIMSHQIFVKDFKTRIGPELMKDNKIFVTYDESQDGLRKVGNKIWRLFNMFTKNKRKVLLSGTPVSQPMDTYGVVKLLDPSIYTSKRVFMNTHVAEQDYFGNVVRWKNLKLMKEALYRNAVVIPDSDFDELPPLVIDHVPYELTAGHMKLYQQLVKEEMIKTDKGMIIDATETARMFHTLQRFVTSPHRMDIKRVHANLFKALWTLYNEDDSKLIVFSNYKDTNWGVLRFFESQKVGVVGVWGDQTSKQQEDNKTAFMTDDTVKVLVGNPRSLGVGTDGLQNVCYREVFTELPLTPTQFEQAVGRVHRTGQKDMCVIKCLIAQETIQQNLYHALLNKDDLLRQIVEQKINLRNLFSG